MVGTDFCLATSASTKGKKTKAKIIIKIGVVAVISASRKAVKQDLAWFCLQVSSRLYHRYKV
jgi:hypothetical protein